MQDRKRNPFSLHLILLATILWFCSFWIPYGNCREIAALTPPPGTVWEAAAETKGALDIEWGQDIPHQDIQIRSLRYTGSTWKAEPQRIYALYAHPEGNGPFPAILQIHGGGQTCYKENLAFFVKHGYACLSFDWTGPRDERPLDQVTNWHSDFAGSIMGPDDQQPGQNLIYHVVLAAIHAIDILQQQPEVDPQRIGVQGISWGGYITWLVNGLDPRVGVAVPTYGIGGLTTQWSDIALAMKQRSLEFIQMWQKNYEPSAFALSQHGAVLFANATNDFFGQMPEAEALLSQLQVNHRRSYGPNRMHSLDPETVTAAMAWFACHLHHENQTTAQLPSSFLKEPLLKVTQTEAGVPLAEIEVDPSQLIKSVRVDFSRGALPALLKCWLSTPATQKAEKLWTAELPVVEAAQPLAAYAQVTYENAGMLSSEVKELIPAVALKGSQGTVLASDILSDWKQGPSGWFIQRGTDFTHAEVPLASLESGTVNGHPALLYQAAEVPEEIHLATRLIADPARNKGNQQVMELWTHDLGAVKIRTNWFLRQPGARVHQATLEAASGWTKTVLSLQDFTAYDEDRSQEEENGKPLENWNDVHQLNFIATPLKGGTPAMGLLQWGEPLPSIR
jgi:dienelactone hydrolase